MENPQRHGVLRFLPPADRFVLLRGGPREGAAFDPQPGLELGTFRRRVVAAWVDGLDEDQLDRGDVVEAAFDLVVADHPELDPATIERKGDAANATPPTRDPDPRAPGGARGHTLRRRFARQAHERLSRRVLGQEDAVARVSQALRRSAAGLGDGRGPRGSFLFVGPSGTGKTELARALAAGLGGEERLIRVDCTEYASAHEASRLLGAPPGYVGHEDGGALAKQLAEAGDCVVLFDEIEKAHRALHHLLLQVLDEGWLTDGRGQRADFRQAFVILTSNAGSRDMAEASDRLGFSSADPLEGARLEELVDRALGAEFPPEFLARLDEVVAFRELGQSDVVRIASLALRSLAIRLRGQGARVSFTGGVARWVAARAQRPGEGARAVRHVVRREIESRLADELLADDGPPPWIHVSIRRGRPHLRPGD